MTVYVVLANQPALGAEAVVLAAGRGEVPGPDHRDPCVARAEVLQVLVAGEGPDLAARDDLAQPLDRAAHQVEALLVEDAG